MRKIELRAGVGKIPKREKLMLRTGAQYRDSLQDGRNVWIDGEKVKDVTDAPGLQADRRYPRPDLRHGA